MIFITKLTVNFLKKHDNLFFATLKIIIALKILRPIFLKLYLYFKSLL